MTDGGEWVGINMHFQVIWGGLKELRFIRDEEVCVDEVIGEKSLN